MPVVPGVPGAGLPAGDDAIIRRIQELERVQRETLPAVMAVVGPAIADLQNQQSALTDLVNTELTSASDSSSADGMAFGTTEASAYTGTPLIIPSIYKSVVVMCIAGIRCTNTTGSAIYLYGRPRIEASTGAWATGATLQTAISPGWQGTVSSPEVYRFTFPGVDGQTLTFKAMASVSTAVTATASNFAGYSYIALMSRT